MSLEALGRNVLHVRKLKHKKVLLIFESESDVESCFKYEVVFQKDYPLTKFVPFESDADLE